MRPRHATWREVRVDSYIQDRNGQVWRVMEFDREARKIRLRDRTGRAVAVNPHRPD
ncbi:MAG: hypothetical protein QOC92_4495, partial [Acidimicrobiaceae bacterium]